MPAEAIDADARSSSTTIDFDAVAAYERRFRHDVMAHVHAFGDVAPAARPYIHLGATSAFVTDNADLILMRRGLELLRAKVVGVLQALAAFAREWRDEPTLGYTHLQPAQLTTVGKRATLWMQDLVLDYEDLSHRIARLPFRGVKGTTGTQASFLQLFEGDHEQRAPARRARHRRHGLRAARCRSRARRTRRKLDAQVLGAVAGVAASASKFSGDIRMLQAFGEIEEPFEREQIGSSAMAYKRNPMRSERIASLARFVPLARAERRTTRTACSSSSARSMTAPTVAWHPRVVPGYRRDPRDLRRTWRAVSRCTRRASGAAPGRRAAVHGDREADRPRRARPAATARRRTR